MFALASPIKLEEMKGSAQSASRSPVGPFKVSRANSNQPQVYQRVSEWSTIENAKYAAFIEVNAPRMEGRPHGKLWPVYQEMAKVVKTRNFRQCKSHHQKMCNEHENIQEIVSSLLKACPAMRSIYERESQDLAEKKQSLVLETNYALQPTFGKDDAKLLPSTDDAYHNEGMDATEHGKSEQKFGSFPSLAPSLFSGFPMRRAAGNKEEEWRECHNLFLEWTSRLNNLVRPFGY